MEFKLTGYSHGAGCGCKIAPQLLRQILNGTTDNSAFADLLVGNAHSDDAAVLRLNDTKALISTTDFFMPIVDDAEDFGKIAAANAISDIYAMGGKPVLAIAILGWPVNTLPAVLAGRVIQGARTTCAEAGIPLAGGHSIDSPEPIFGLAVNGIIEISRLKKNSGALPGDLIYLTKPLGIGIFTTAQKRGLLSAGHHALACQTMIQLNSVGEELSALNEVHAMTDVTGFGLAGHLLEVCAASGVSATIELNKLPLLDKPALQEYIRQGCVPGGTQRNYASYGHQIAGLDETSRSVLCDPQTSGGLLICVSAGRGAQQVESILKNRGLYNNAIGVIQMGEPHSEVRIHHI
jgi:selenide, water dikinase